MGTEFIDKVLDSASFKLDNDHAEVHVAIMYDPQFEAAKRDIDTLISSNMSSNARKSNYLYAPVKCRQPAVPNSRRQHDTA